MKLLGGFIMGFVTVIVALSLFSGGIASNVNSVTTTRTITNASLGSPSADATQNLEGIAASSVVVSNATGGEAVPATNYTISNYVVDSTGLLTAQYTQNAGAYAGQALNISYVYEPEGYATDAGSRAVSSLILIFTALAILVIGVMVAINKDLLNMMR